MWGRFLLTACLLVALCHLSETSIARPHNCVGRCSPHVNQRYNCQCNPKCHQYSNCCPDKDRVCGRGPITPSGSAPKATFDELSRLFTSLWNADDNRVQINLNYQNQTNTTNNVDMAPQSLFQNLSSRILNKPTFRTFMVLLNNYDHNVGRAEDRLPSKKKEEEAFLNAILSTEVIKKTYDFLKKKGLVGNAMSDFKIKLREMWFNTYSRSKGVQDSSGFEHVFVGEFKHRAVTGLHNWLQFYNEEKHRRLNYMGWIYKRKRGILGLKFKWLNKMKPISTIQVGPSPEFDIAMLSTCFLINPPRGNCLFKINTDKFTVKVYKDNRSPSKIGSAFLQ